MPTSPEFTTLEARCLDGDFGDESRAACRVAVVAQGLSHPARVAIVRRLAEHGAMLTGDIVKGSGLAQSTVSEHLRVLREARIVVSERDGQRVWNRLERDVLTHVADALTDVADHQPARV